MLLSHPSLPRSCSRTISRETSTHVALDAFLASRIRAVAHVCLSSPFANCHRRRRWLYEGGRASVERYWSADFSQKLEGSDEELLEGLGQRLSDAVRQRLIADVPLGAFLSGGLDSAAIVGAMADLSSGPVKTFSIGFDDPRLDGGAQRGCWPRQFGTEHHELLVEPEAPRTPRLIHHYGEPFADATAIPTFYLAEMARHHVTVALTGDGGDETLGGYHRYVINRQLARFGRTPISLRKALGATADWIPASSRVDSTASRLRRSVGSLADTPAQRYTRYMSDFQGFDRHALYTAEFAELVAESRVPTTISDPWSFSRATDVVDLMLDVDGQTTCPTTSCSKLISQRWLTRSKPELRCSTIGSSNTRRPCPPA